MSHPGRALLPAYWGCVTKPRGLTRAAHARILTKN